MSEALKIKLKIFEMLEQYEGLEGKSGDYYYKEIIFHPMACGKYLSILNILYENNLISYAFYKVRIKKIEKLLVESAIKDGKKEELKWGLNFSYKTTSAEEPFVITSSIICLGIYENLRVINKEMLDLSKSWLENLKEKKIIEQNNNKIIVPKYSPNTEGYATNMIAYWSNLLYKVTGKVRYKEVLEYVNHLYEPLVGWQYEDNNKRVDLLHNFYILNSLFDYLKTEEIEKKTYEIINNYLYMGKIYDKYDVITYQEKKQFENKLKKYIIKKIKDDRYILVFENEARDWSLGETLVLTSKLMVIGKEKKYWRKISNIIVEEIFLRYERKVDYFFRDEMHILHGLVNYLINLRKLKEI